MAGQELCCGCRARPERRAGPRQFWEKRHKPGTQHTWTALIAWVLLLVLTLRGHARIYCGCLCQQGRAIQGCPGAWKQGRVHTKTPGCINLSLGILETSKSSLELSLWVPVCVQCPLHELKLEAGGVAPDFLIHIRPYSENLPGRTVKPRVN